MNKRQQTVLIVDDAEDNVRLLSEALSDEFEIRSASSGEEGLSVAKKGSVDVVLVSVAKPGMDGYAVCESLKSDEGTASIPVILVGDAANPSDHARGLEVGAVDFLTKPFSPPLLKARLKTHVDLKAKTDFIEQLDDLDGLTRISNWREFDECLNREWRRATRAGHWLSLILFDLDRFKAYNDHYGHTAGDECLSKVAKCVSELITRGGDMVARYGGEEFGLILAESDSEGALEVAWKIQAGIRRLGIEHAESDVAEVVTASIGVASTVPVVDSSPSVLIQAANEALRSAKEEGRNRIRNKTLG